MKINSLLQEGITAASSPENATSPAPKFGRSDKFLEAEQVEETTSGSVATVDTPVGTTQRRGKGSIFSGIKTSEKFPNSQAVKEEQVNEVDPRNFDSDVDYYAARNAPAKPRYHGQSSPGVNPDDEDYFREIFRKKRLAAQKQEREADHDRLATGTNEGEEINEKSKSQAQFRTMAAVAHNPEFAKKVGISQKVGKEFHSADRKQDYKDLPKEVDEASSQAQQAAIAINMKKHHQKPTTENAEYDDEAGSAESNLHTIARAADGLLDTIDSNENLPEWAQEKIAKVEGMLVAVWDYLESQEEEGIDPQIDEVAAWQKKSGKNKNGGLNQKGVDSYRREHPGSKLQTAVTTKPSKLKPGSKAAKRRKSFCARMSGMKGPMKDEHGKPTRKALSLRKWNCESVEQTVQMLESVKHDLLEMKQRLDPKCWKGYKKQGTKMKGGVRVNNCVPVEEGEGNLEKALDTLGGSWSGWYPDENQFDPNVKTYWYDDGEGGHYASGTVEHNLKTGQVTVDFADEYNDEVKGTFKNMGDAMRALRGGYPGSHGGKAPNFDRLGQRTPYGPDDLRKTDRTGRKGTIGGGYANKLKGSIQHNKGRHGPKGVLPESDISEDKLAQDLYKDLQIFKKGADKDIGSKAKDKDISGKAKDKDIVAKEGVAEGGYPEVDHMPGRRGINLPKAETKQYFTNKKQWQQTVDDINHSKYDDNSEYVGQTGRSTVTINGREWARWSDAQQKGYIEVSSMTEQGVAEDEAGTKGFRVTWSEAGSDKHTSGLLLKPGAIEHAKMLKKKPGTSNVKIVPYRSVEEGLGDTIAKKAKQFSRYMTEPNSPHNSQVRSRAKNIDKIRKQEEKKSVFEKDPEAMREFERSGGYKAGIDVMGWQVGWIAAKHAHGDTMREAFQKLYYGGGASFPFSQKAFKLAWVAYNKHHGPQGNLEEMDGDGAGRDGSNRKSHSTYGSRDKHHASNGPDVHLGSDSAMTSKDIQDRALNTLTQMLSKPENMNVLKRLKNK